MSRQPIWRRGANVAEVRSADSQTIAVLQLDVGEPRVLNNSAASIWLLMDGRRSEHDIVAILCEEYGQPVAVIAPQVAAFFLGLSAERLVEAWPFEDDRQEELIE